jgi:hypothetical protein
VVADIAALLLLDLELLLSRQTWKETLLLQGGESWAKGLSQTRLRSSRALVRAG